jgi:hypothetical protein
MKNHGPVLPLAPEMGPVSQVCCCPIIILILRNLYGEDRFAGKGVRASRQGNIVGVRGYC